jgi:nucleotide-binding universal stress UspA family protein
MIATFYSYRGGVGRSMALANVGEILADMGYRVILCDWDLEAPGLERYLVTNGADEERYRTEMDEFLSWPGLVDLLREYKATLTRPVDDAGESAADTEFASVGSLRLRRPSSRAHRLPRATDRPGSLHLITAGHRAGAALHDYAEDVRRLDWQEFYEQWAGGSYMDFFRRDLVGDPRQGIDGAADILLVDSRTGVTEQGGICTHHLADLVVLVTAANDLNMEGAKWMARALADPGLPATRGGRPLKVLPVASRIEQTAQRDELVSFRRQFLQAFGAQIEQVITDAEKFALAAEIPYMPFYSFHERVVAREPEAQREQKLYAAYQALAEAVAGHGVRAGLLRERTAQGIFVRGQERRAATAQLGAQLDAQFRRLAEAVTAGDAARIAELTPVLESALRSGDGVLPEEAARGFLDAMRRSGRSDLIERMASAVLGSGIEQPFIQIAFARTQVDRGQWAAALSALQSLLPSLKPGSADQIEARLLIGRVCKELYLDADDPRATSSVRNLERAINEFYDVFRLDPREYVWAGSNVFALLLRAARDRVRLESAPDARHIASEVLALAISAAHTEPANVWNLATAFEACLALGRDEDAVRWMDRLLSNPASGAFLLASQAQHLVRMWQLSIDKEPGTTLLSVLRGAALADHNARAVLPLAPGQLPNDPDPGLLGALQAAHRELAQSYRTGAQLAQSVVRLVSPAGEKVAIGILLPGALLDSRLGEGVVMITAAHTFGTSSSPLDAADAAGWRVSFVGQDQQQTQQGMRIREVLFWSPVDQLDVVVMGLDGLPPAKGVLPIALGTPPDGAAGASGGAGAQIRCIGPIGTTSESLAIVACPWVDSSGPVLHYRIEGVPGSSGSPLFNERWQLIGLQHAMVPGAAGASGSETVGEGITIEALRRQLSSALLRSEPEATADPVNLFISYSHHDVPLVNQLRMHLKLLERRGLIRTWSDRQILPGESWDQAMCEQLEHAELVLLAISADFLASDYAYGREMQRALELNRAGRLLIAPVILRPCDWESLDIARFQVLPRQGRPVTSWPNVDEAWTDVARSIRSLVEHIRKARQVPGGQAA